jgi:hypothetical protein
MADNNGTIYTLSIDAEAILLRIARGTIKPITYGQLAALLSAPTGPIVDLRWMGRILDQIAQRYASPQHPEHWRRFLVAYVVSVLGDVGEGYGRIGNMPTPDTARSLANEMAKTKGTRPV